MGYDCYFDGPNSYTDKYAFYNVGASPYLLQTLINHLEKNKANITEIFLCFYLYNNAILNDKLEELAKAGIKIHVITIPIEGYDNSNPKEIIDIKTRSVLKDKTKYALAKEIFAKHYNREIPNFTLYFFPHIYLRSPKVKKFSRGNMPYSLHLKSFLIKYKEGVGDVGITSSNFAVRDLVKEENLLLIKNELSYFNAAAVFFNDLLQNAIPIYEFDFKKDYTNYAVKTILLNAQVKEIGFMAPFYADSAFYAEDAIKQLVDSAQHSITIVGQHICPVDYTIDGKYHSSLSNEEIQRKGFLDNVIAKAKAGIKVSFISQTFASGNAKTDKDFRTPANKASFIKFYEMIKGVPNILYAVNENIHSKYIIVDDKVFVSSFNFTPTQFIYLDKVSIEKFDNNPGKSYKGIYCETGQYCIISDTAITKQYQQNVDELLKRNETTIVKQQ